MSTSPCECATGCVRSCLDRCAATHAHAGAAAARACYLRCSHRCALGCTPTAESVESYLPTPTGELAEAEAEAAVEAELVYRRPSYSVGAAATGAGRGTSATHALEPLAGPGPLW